MELPEIVEFARNFSVLIRINGPDPKGLKMRNHAFHQYHSGKTTLSASGLLLPKNLLNLVDWKNGAVVVTVASIIEPFLSPKSKLINTQGVPELIPGARLDVMVEVKPGMAKSQGDDNPKWFAAEVLKLVDVPAASSAIQSLIEASSASLDHGWEIGWSLATQSDNSQKFKNSMKTQGRSDTGFLSENSSDVNLMANVAVRIAFLQVPMLLDKELPEIMISCSNKRGDFLVSLGSPFGVLSPLHFFNSIAVGSVANCYPSASMDKSLLMADIRCLPGMEGGPIFGQHGCLVGILNRPLRQRGGAEIQVVIPWKAIDSACNGLLQFVPEKAERVQFTENSFCTRAAPENCLNCITKPNMIEKQPVRSGSLPLKVEQAMNSVCLITLSNGVWASGVVLNKEGLILTNAHLLEPWRFGRATIQTGLDETQIKNPLTLLESSLPIKRANDSKNTLIDESNSLQPLNYLRRSHGVNRIHQVHGEISVRINFGNSWLWCNAKVVYISKGPLDISLLQLLSVPTQLCPVNVDLACPSLGSNAFVIGHGLLGPRCDLLPTISSGVVAKVVSAKSSVPHLPGLHESPGTVPVMLETTAAVHPGASGGAVVNNSGCMIALVTSNAKHGGGTVIPHMNFSIPSAALEPVFRFAKDMQNVSLLQQLDRPNKDLTSVWAMMPPISPDPDPSSDNLLKKDEKQNKGSQFAKFINERKDLFKKSCDLNTMQDLSRDTIPSKL